MKFFALLAIVLSSCAIPAFAQISPPGLDDTNLATWGAVGFSQDLNPKWTLTAYLGGARVSNPDRWFPLKKQSIAVYNHEFQYKFNPRWQASLCSSIRLQNKYDEEFPYRPADQAYRWEIRYYGRLYNKQQVGKVNMTYSFRPEFRTFYSPDWTPSSTPIELRFRLKAQASIPLNTAKSNFLLGANEFLSTIDEYTLNTPTGREHTWSNYQLTEDRLSVYFRHVFKDQDVILDLGVMEQFKTRSDFDAVSYVAFDLLIQNPFSKHR
ncbi:MAG TPA: DUF2490 domain-containing protein [Dyadobacter sp.]|jgi:hypothetical protein|nr:DUF2490 domain-containing protein [Dyadobacter sp.]